MARRRHLFRTAVPVPQPIADRKRRERERDQRRDPLPDREAEPRLRTHVGDGADEHAAGTSDRVVHLAARLDDSEYGFAHSGAIAAAGFP